MKVYRNRRKQIEPLEAIKRLLILALLRDGVKSEDIGKTIGMDGSSIRHLIPVRKIKEK